MRLALAQFFDHPASRHHLGKIENCEIDFAPGYRSTALLLAGWLAAQLDWTLEKESRNFALNFSDKTGRRVKIVLNQNGAEPISRCLLRNDLKEFRVTHAAGADLPDISSSRPRGRKHAPTHARRRERSSSINKSGIDARRPSSRLLLRAHFNRCASSFSARSQTSR